MICKFLKDNKLLSNVYWSRQLLSTLMKRGAGGSYVTLYMLKSVLITFFKQSLLKVNFVFVY